MTKYSITDPRWRGGAIGMLVFLTAAGTVLYVWVTAMRPFPNELPSQVVYYVVLCALVGVVAAICAAGFTYRWTQIDSDALVVHEGFCGVIWKRRIVPKSSISAVERYDRSRAGVFTHVPSSGIRVRLSDGSAIVLAETDGEGRYHREVTEIRKTLNLAGDG